MYFLITLSKQSSWFNNNFQKKLLQVLCSYYGLQMIPIETSQSERYFITKTHFSCVILFYMYTFASNHWYPYPLDIFLSFHCLIATPIEPQPYSIICQNYVINHNVVQIYNMCNGTLRTSYPAGMSPTNSSLEF